MKRIQSGQKLAGHARRINHQLFPEGEPQCGKTIAGNADIICWSVGSGLACIPASATLELPEPKRPAPAVIPETCSVAERFRKKKETKTLSDRPQERRLALLAPERRSESGLLRRRGCLSSCTAPARVKALALPARPPAKTSRILSPCSGGGGRRGEEGGGGGRAGPG